MKNLIDIPTEITHDGTTQVKRLIKPYEQHPGNIATMNYAWLEPQKCLTPHIHVDGEEFYFFIEGSGKIQIGTNWSSVRKGDFFTIPIDKTHSVKNTGKNNLVFITIRTMLQP